MVPVIALLFVPFFLVMAACFSAVAPFIILVGLGVAACRVGWECYLEAFTGAYKSVQKTLPSYGPAKALPAGHQALAASGKHPRANQLTPLTPTPNAEKIQAEIDAEIADALRIVENMPKTASEASKCLDEANSAVKLLESMVEAAETAAKNQSGNWGALCEARQKLEQAQLQAKEALENLERFPKEIAGSSGGMHSSFGMPPEADPATAGLACGRTAYQAREQSRVDSHSPQDVQWNDAVRMVAAARQRRSLAPFHGRSAALNQLRSSQVKASQPLLLHAVRQPPKAVPSLSASLRKPLMAAFRRL